MQIEMNSSYAAFMLLEILYQKGEINEPTIKRIRKMYSQMKSHILKSA